MTKQKIQFKIMRIPLVDKNYNQESKFNPMSQLYLELFENKKKLKKELINSDYMDYSKIPNSKENENFDIFSINSDSSNKLDEEKYKSESKDVERYEKPASLAEPERYEKPASRAEPERDEKLVSRRDTERDEKPVSHRDTEREKKNKKDSSRRSEKEKQTSSSDPDQNEKPVEPEREKKNKKDSSRRSEKENPKISSDPGRNEKPVESEREKKPGRVEPDRTEKRSNNVSDTNSIKSMNSDNSYMSNDKLKRKLIDLLGKSKTSNPIDTEEFVYQKYNSTELNNLNNIPERDIKNLDLSDMEDYKPIYKNDIDETKLYKKKPASAERLNNSENRPGITREKTDSPTTDYINNPGLSKSSEKEIERPPPSLSEINKMSNRSKNIEDAGEMDNKKRHLIFKFKSLQKSYPSEQMPEFTIYSDYAVMKDEYENALRRISLDSTVENYKKYITYGFMAVEYVLGNFFGLDMKGFTQQQLISMKSYERLLIELGEKNYEPSGSSKWPVEIRLLFLILINSAFFVGSKIIFKQSGTNFIDVMNNFSSFVTTPDQAKAKPKMKEPEVDLDDL